MVAKNILSALIFASTTCFGITMVKAQLQGDCARTYVVQQGDSCFSVAVSQKVPTYQLLKANPLINPDSCLLYPGDTLCLGLVGRDCNIIYNNQHGEDCTTIASKNDISVEQFLIDNPNIYADCSNIGRSVYCVAPANTSA